MYTTQHAASARPHSECNHSSLVPIFASRNSFRLKLLSDPSGEGGSWGRFPGTARRCPDKSDDRIDDAHICSDSRISYWQASKHQRLPNPQRRPSHPVRHYHQDCINAPVVSTSERPPSNPPLKRKGARKLADASAVSERFFCPAPSTLCRHSLTSQPV